MGGSIRSCGIRFATRFPSEEPTGRPGSTGCTARPKRVIGDDANLLWELPRLEGRVFSVDIGADGAVLAAASSLNGRGMVRLYRMDVTPEVPEPIQQLLFKPTHQRSEEERKQLQEHFEAGVETLAEFRYDGSPTFAISVSSDGSSARRRRG